MKKSLFCILILGFCFTSCDKDPVDKVETDLPDCIQTLVDDQSFEEELFMVKTQEIDGDLHYWLGTGANAWDGDEYIVDDNCEVVCTLAAWFPLPCADRYEGDWEVVWEQ